MKLCFLLCLLIQLRKNYTSMTMSTFLAIIIFIHFTSQLLYPLPNLLFPQSLPLPLLPPPLLLWESGGPPP